MADECNHRDVNHTFASMETDDPNPFLQSHRENAYMAWRLTADTMVEESPKANTTTASNTAATPLK
jgi:hypothetical protein